MKQHLLLGVLAAALMAGCTYRYGYKPVRVASAPETEVGQKQVSAIPGFYQVDFYQVCEKIELKDGDYYAGTPEMPATYSVRDGATICRLKILTEYPEMSYVDKDCDSTLDYAYSNGQLFDRETLAKEEDIKHFDEELKLEQAMVCEKNRMDERLLERMALGMDS